MMHINIQNNFLMPSAKSCIKKILKGIDLFPNSQLLRYNGEPEYTTATGGLVSFVLIVLLIVIFASMGYRTINKQIISSSTSIQHQSSSTPLTFQTSPEGGFMFAILPWGFDLQNTTERAFDVTMSYLTLKPVFVPTSVIPITLEQCTKQHFNFTQ